MKKEIIIIIVIIILIITAHVVTQNYTKNSFAEINNKLDEIRDLGKEIQENEKAKESGQNVLDEDIQDKKKELSKKIENMQNEWKKVNKITAFYIEHDELEKVNASMIKFKSYFELEEYSEAIPELEDCKYILNHIKEKEAMQFINLF